MKKTLIAMLLMAGSFGVVAQDTTTTLNTTMTSSSNYSAYSAPANIQMYMTRDYPTAVNVTWTPVSEYWRATYNNMGRYNHVYYMPNGDHYTVTLPVTSTWVPDEMISRAGTLYGTNIYDIIALKGANGGTVYQVRFLDNGVLKTEWIDETGMKITEYYRTDEANTTSVNTNVNTNTSTELNTTTETQTGEVKTKVETGTMKIKSETENGKTKTKVKKNN